VSRNQPAVQRLPEAETSRMVRAALRSGCAVRFSDSYETSANRTLDGRAGIKALSTETAEA